MNMDCSQAGHFRDRQHLDRVESRKLPNRAFERTVSPSVNRVPFLFLFRACTTKKMVGVRQRPLFEQALSGMAVVKVLS